jgi:hypothetical protein
MFRELADWLNVLIVVWPVTLVLFLAIALSVASFAMYRRAEAGKKNLVLRVAVYLGAAALGVAGLVALALFVGGCCEHLLTSGGR